jgi:hypothetical protein
MRKFFLILLCTCIGSTAFAQDPADLSPSPALKKLDWMVGKWKVKAADFVVSGQALKLDAEMSVSWEGQFLKAKTRHEYTGGISFSELLMIGYDAESQKYVASAYTNFSPEPRKELGTLIEGVLHLESGPWKSSGGTSFTRIQFSKKSDDKITFKLSLKLADGQWQEATAFDFERVKE